MKMSGRAKCAATTAITPLMTTRPSAYGMSSQAFPTAAPDNDNGVATLHTVNAATIARNIGQCGSAPVKETNAQYASATGTHDHEPATAAMTVDPRSKAASRCSSER